MFWRLFWKPEAWGQTVLPEWYRTKIAGKCQNSKIQNATFRVIFKHCGLYFKKSLALGYVMYCILTATLSASSIFHSSFRLSWTLFAKQIVRNAVSPFTTVRIVRIWNPKGFIFSTQKNIHFVYYLYNPRVLCIVVPQKWDHLFQVYCRLLNLCRISEATRWSLLQ